MKERNIVSLFSFFIKGGIDMLYNPDIYFKQTLTGFVRVPENKFDKNSLYYIHRHVINYEANYDLNVFVRPSLLFYLFHKNDKNTWEILGRKWFIWFNKKQNEIGFDYDYSVEGE